MDWHFTADRPIWQQLTELLLVSLIAEIVLSAVFFFITNCILKNKLNLE